jgi:hypothetical protein
VVHGITFDWRELQAIIAADEKIERPPKLLEERGRGTLIRNIKSQGKLLQYWAWPQTNIEVGILFPEENRNIEYWMDLKLQPVPDDSKPEVYPTILKNMCLHRLREISNGVAQMLDSLGDEFRVETRYLFNSLRVWFCPTAVYNSRVKRPLAEDPIPKDKWYSWTDLMAFSFPPIPEVREEPSIFFGPGAYLQERYDDEEVQGGKIALIAFKQMRAQRPPNVLDRKALLKQIAYNQRVMEAEDEIAGINCDIPHFLSEIGSEERVIVCVNSSEEMNRHEEAMAGQL